jgi:hypothetical protein
LKTFDRLGVSGELGWEELECYFAPEASVFSQVDDAHPSATELLEDAVMGDGFAEHQVVRRILAVGGSGFKVQGSGFIVVSRLSPAASWLNRLQVHDQSGESTGDLIGQLEDLVAFIRRKQSPLTRFRNVRLCFGYRSFGDPQESSELLWTESTESFCDVGGDGPC